MNKSEEAELLLPGFADTVPPTDTGAADAKTSESEPVIGVVPPPVNTASRLVRPACVASASKTIPARAAKITVAALLAVIAGVSIAVTLRLVKPREVVRESVREVPVETGIPLELLPDTADASLWELLSNMHGPVNGTILQFRRGIASADGVTYRLQFDFCRSGEEAYARVFGEKPFVVRVNGQGRIVKTYPAPRGGKPLRDLFGR